jgi:hypothetical protein
MESPSFDLFLPQGRPMRWGVWSVHDRVWLAALSRRFAEAKNAGQLKVSPTRR